METRGAYRTRQRELIVEYLQAGAENNVTAEALARYLESRGEKVSLTTVYRTLDRLVREGSALKYAAPDGSRACYRYLSGSDAADSCKLVCLDCGHIFNVECHRFDGLAEHIASEHRFRVDSRRTVFYGHCADCAARCGKGAAENGGEK